MKLKPLWLKWIFCIIPAFIALILYLILPYFPKLTEYVFSRGLFRIIGFPLQWIMSIFPFSITELVVILAIPAILTLLTTFIIRIIKREEKLKIFEKGMRFTAWCLSLSLLIYMIMHGANYYRLPAGELLNLPNREYTAKDLYTVTCDIADKASAAREKLSEDKNGNTTLSAEISEILKQTDNCYDNLQKEYPFLKSAVWRIKSVALSHYWSYTGTTGVYCPWTSEANANTDVPSFNIPHTAAHEMAHTMGIAKEDECNFIAWLACAKSGIADYEYSGYLSAYIYCSNALYVADRELWQKAISHCSDGVIRDLNFNNSYWEQFEGEVMESSQDFNDSFIKANGVESGILSYDQMVELMLRYYDIEVI